MGKAEEVELHLQDPEALQQYLQVAEEYTTGEEENPIQVRHPNRHHQDNTTSPRPQRSKQVRAKAAQGSDTTQPEALPGVLDKDIFEYLARYEASPCVSLYIPTHAAGASVNEQADAILFKTKLQQVRERLVAAGQPLTEVEALLQPGYALILQEKFWVNLGAGLAVFIADGFFKYIILPTTPSEEMYINTSFYVSPLLPLMTQREYFYLLVISKKQAKLFRADSFGMRHIELHDLPNGVEDVVHVEEKDDQTLFRTGSSGGGSGASYHGMGGGRPNEKANIAQYLQEVDDTLWEHVLHDQHVPLLLAGVDYLIPLYKQVTHYNYVWIDAIPGSHEHDDMATLHRLTMEKMRPYFETARQKALTLYGNQSATELTSAVPDMVIPASHYGQVSHLFVVKDVHLWGTFDANTNQLTIHDTQQAGDDCLLDKAVLHTVLQGGQVFRLSPEDMPADSVMAAVLRYTS